MIVATRPPKRLDKLVYVLRRPAPDAPPRRLHRKVPAAVAGLFVTIPYIADVESTDLIEADGNIKSIKRTAVLKNGEGKDAWLVIECAAEQPQLTVEAASPAS